MIYGYNFYDLRVPFVLFQLLYRDPKFGTSHSFLAILLFIFGLPFIIYLTFLKIIMCRFSPIDTNAVLREFEKCGVILKHILGPRDANWMHILYQVFQISINLSSCSDYVVHACIFIPS